jgi:hypothetical protein
MFLMSIWFWFIDHVTHMSVVLSTDWVLKRSPVALHTNWIKSPKALSVLWTGNIVTPTCLSHQRRQQKGPFKSFDPIHFKSIEIYECPFSVCLPSARCWQIVPGIHLQIRYTILSTVYIYAFDQQYNRCRVNVSKTEQKIISHFNGLVAYLDINLNLKWQSFVFFCCQIGKKAEFYVLQLRPKLDYTY